MRLITWNINGISTMPKYHPWLNCKGDWDEILDELGADITCVQETKIVKPKITKAMACLSRYEAFFSSNRRIPAKGYSGTGIYTKHATCMPGKAEEGISGILQQNDRPMIPVKDRIGGYPSSSAIDDLDLSQSELADLDTEGRTTVVDMGLFVLINVYCPNQTNEERLAFKMAFSQVLEMRIRALIAAGREVILVGDINVVATELDHCDPSHSGGPDGYMDTLPRKWFQRLIGPAGPLTDVTRRFHPTRASMFTCWETRINAREGNYGTRLDYVCVTPALLPWIKGSDIMNTVKGSDHCPVYVDFFDQRTLDDGTTVELWPLINPPNRSRDAIPEAPAFSARNYPEFKVRNLSSMWSKQPKPSPSPSPALPVPTSQTPASSPEDELSVDAAVAKLHTVPVEAKSSTQLQPSTYVPEASSSKLPTPKTEPRPPLQPSSQKSSSKSAPFIEPASKAKGKSPGAEQSSISSFFAPPPKPEKKKKKKRKASDEEIEGTIAKKAKAHEVVDVSGDDEAPMRSGVRGSQEDRLDEVDAVAVVNSAEAWSAIFKKTEAPLCFHNEPTKEWMTNKPGPNKGRKFWLCQRPVGEGHRSKSKQLTPHRCDFFKFSTDVARPYVVSDDAKARRTK